MSKLAKLTVAILVVWALGASALAAYDAVAARRWQREVDTLTRELRRTQTLADAASTGSDAAALRDRLARLATRLDAQTTKAEAAAQSRDALATLLERAQAATEALGRCATAADGPLGRAATPSTTSTTTTTTLPGVTGSTPTTPTTPAPVVIAPDPEAASARATCKEAATQGLAMVSELKAALNPAPTSTTTPTGVTGTASTTTRP